MKLFYKGISYKDMLEKERDKKIPDWEELDLIEKNQIQKLAELLDKNEEFN